MVSLRSVIFMVDFFIIDPPQANLKFSIFNRKYSIPLGGVARNAHLRGLNGGSGVVTVMLGR